ncbi:thyroid receptor-interacting protein 11-like isoform X2 [Atheta coriaria]
MKDELQTENSGLKLQQQDLAKENHLLRSSIEQEQKRIKFLESEKIKRDEVIQALQSEIDQFRRESSDIGSPRVSIEEINRLETMVADYNRQIAIYEEELQKLRRSTDSDIRNLSGDTTSVTTTGHQQYIDILVTALNGIDFNLNRWSVAKGESDDNMKDYDSLVTNIVNGILDYKWKCESMQEEIKNAAAEKKLLLAEKNSEIEKLMLNTQELSSSLKTKNNELKHYETECSQLSDNNEALIAQLQESKQADMTLHTIPEMNEHLDGQLEKCYKRIDQLEGELEETRSNMIDDLKSQLSLCNKDLVIAKESLEEWQSNFYKLDDENKSLKSYLETIRRRFSECDNEREELEDQVKLDNESMAEQNLNLETLQEEIETLTANILELRRDNTRYVAEREGLERKLEEAEQEIMDLKEEMTTEIEQSLKKDQHLSELNGTVDVMQQNIIKLKNLTENLSKENEDLTLARSTYILQYRHFKKDVEDLILCYKDLKAYQKNDDNMVQSLIREKNELINQYNNMHSYEAENSKLMLTITELQTKIDLIEKEKLLLQKACDAHKGEQERFQTLIDELNASRNEIIKVVQQKHQENITYHEEIQRLHQLLVIETEKSKTFETQLAELNGTSISSEDLLAKEKELEKLTEHGDFLREKCAQLAEALLAEQSITKELYAERVVQQEKEANLTRQLESLRQHLIEIEEMYTKEIQTAETKCAEMQQKMQAIVEKEKNSSTRFTSANIRANQQVETLQTNLQLVTNQRDELKRKMSELEDQMEKQNAALCNLQIVLEQFQREKDKVIFEETERVRRQVAVEKRMQADLETTIGDLKKQLDESKMGLKAAVRLSDQVEASKRHVGMMKEEVAKLQQQLLKSEEKNSKLLNQTDGRVDKMLIKNLVIGLVNCNNALNKDQNQILKIISTVLDFNQQDIEKVNLNKKDQSTWFSSLLHPQALSDRNMSSESLSQAFVKFLEAESKPRNLPNLLDASTVTVGAASKEGGESSSSNSSRKTSVRQSPLLLNEVVLPTFADFAANRNSSSILKDVLKDNTNVS